MGQPRPKTMTGDPARQPGWGVCGAAAKLKPSHPHSTLLSMNASSHTTNWLMNLCTVADDCAQPAHTICPLVCSIICDRMTENLAAFGRALPPYRYAGVYP